jgi:hypothetical protein
LTSGSKRWHISGLDCIDEFRSKLPLSCTCERGLLLSVRCNITSRCDRVLSRP